MNYPGRNFFYLIWLIVTLLGCPAPEVPPPNTEASRTQSTETRSNPWVLVDSKSETVTVFPKIGKPVVFENAAFGAAGVKNKVKQGDDVTPVGRFLITHISYASKYSVFIGLNYPRSEDAERGLATGIITQAAYRRIVSAHKGGRTPPHDTPLGGLIGLHGVGKGSLEIHSLANWTAGCVALTNAQIRQLARMVSPGVEVEIR